ncbi:unnamed protein product [Boreogadus saida]
MRGTGDRHKPLTMAEATAEFENILLHCDIQGYLYEPEYSEEELRRIEEEAASAAAEHALPVAEEPDRAGKVNWKRQPKPAGRNGCLSTEQYRLTSYRHFLEWILQGERLGRGNRLVLPACVVQAIRANYPTQDGQYRGYQETVDAQDEL